MTKRPLRINRLFSSSLGVLAFAGIVVLVALVGQRHWLRLDLTESKRYSLSQQSRQVVEALKDDLHIKAFFQEGSGGEAEARDLLETYRYYSKKIHYQFIDPDRHPGQARQYQIRSYGTLVLEGPTKTQTITQADEEAITNAIVKITREEEKVVYFLEGHGERQIDDHEKNGYSSLKGAIEKENFRVKTLNLLKNPRIPDDASLLVIAGPQTALLPREIEVLEDYLVGRGSLLIMLEPFADGGLREFLSSYGLDLHEDIIVDTMSRVFGADYLMPVITRYGRHRVTEGFNIACFFPTARGVFTGEHAPQGVNVRELASTSEYSWSETDYRQGEHRQPEFDTDKDRKGPVPVAAIATLAAVGKEQPEESDTKANPAPARVEHNLAVFGDCDFASNNYLKLQGNADLFLNTINYLAQQEELITIERPEPESTPLTLSRTQGRLLFWIGLVLMPVVVLGAGLTVYRLRRKHR